MFELRFTLRNPPGAYKKRIMRKIDKESDNNQSVSCQLKITLVNKNSLQWTEMVVEATANDGNLLEYLAVCMGRRIERVVIADNANKEDFGILSKVLLGKTIKGMTALLGTIRDDTM